MRNLVGVALLALVPVIGTAAERPDWRRLRAEGRDRQGRGPRHDRRRLRDLHGPTLQGLGEVPGIAGRHPNYIVRQLWSMQNGERSGSWTALMKAAVDKLTVDDMLAIAAYTASRAPQRRRATTSGHSDAVMLCKGAIVDQRAGAVDAQTLRAWLRQYAPSGAFQPP